MISTGWVLANRCSSSAAKRIISLQISKPFEVSVCILGRIEDGFPSAPVPGRPAVAADAGGKHTAARRRNASLVQSLLVFGKFVSLTP